LGRFVQVMVMEVTYKVVRFGTFEKSGTGPCNSLLSSALHITKKQTKWILKKNVIVSEGFNYIIHELVQMNIIT
jgi:hypothetical protein